MALNKRALDAVAWGGGEVRTRFRDQTHYVSFFKAGARPARMAAWDVFCEWAVRNGVKITGPGEWSGFVDLRGRRA
jgi:hypothetical protein